MDTPEIESFREELRDYFAANLPGEVATLVSWDQHPGRPALAAWTKALHRKGWATPAWPKEWGGPGWNAVQQLVFQEELARAHAPDPLIFNVSMLAPVIMAVGTDAQRSEFLPKLAALDLWFCQGFSEPEAGSDLASLTTRARLEGDEYVVSGQKTWTSHAHLADWIFTLVRTNAGPVKQEGISFLLIDLSSPGIEIRPIPSVDGGTS